MSKKRAAAARRNIHAAIASKKDPEALAQRMEHAKQLIRDYPGIARHELVATLKPTYGFGVGQSTFRKLRESVERENRRAARRSPPSQLVPTPASPPKSLASYVSATSLAAYCIEAGVPFRFDGSKLIVEAAR
jgi:hypothetical protein